MDTTATRDGDDWILNGEKWHLTSGDVADYAVVQAATDPKVGDGNTLFFMDLNSPGIEIIDYPKYMHNLIVEHPRVRLNNVRVPNVNVLGGVGRGLELSKEWFRHERVMIAARCCGAAERLLDEATEFAKSRVQFGSPIAYYQAIQFMLADSLTELWAARLMMYETARASDAAKSEEEIKRVHAKSSMVKLFASEMAGRAADRAVQIFGGRGYANLRRNAFTASCGWSGFGRARRRFSASLLRTACTSAGSKRTLRLLLRRNKMPCESACGSLRRRS
jgi:alkylation response protein AidB-like acyl-CoA dehydrogenase